jgi:3-hydroxyisobutyrate dehydrogenase-like beta-hydroxyacid dehydrogenase
VLKGFPGPVYLGRFGNGSKMKFAANLLVAIHNVSTAEAVILARRSGLDPALAVQGARRRRRRLAHAAGARAR